MFNFTSAEILEESRQTWILFGKYSFHSTIQALQAPTLHSKLNKKGFSNTIPLPMLSVDADSRVKLFRDCCFSAWNYKVHIKNMENQAETRRTQQVPTSSHQNKVGSSTWVPIFQLAAPPPPV